MRKIIIERKKLYREIWEKRLGLVAEDYNIRIEDMRKICNVMNVPRPSSGHWAKLLHGKDSPVISLPDDYDGKETIEFTVDDTSSTNQPVLWNSDSEKPESQPYLIDKMIWIASDEVKVKLADDILRYFKESEDIKMPGNLKAIMKSILERKREFDKDGPDSSVNNILQSMRYSWGKTNPVVNIRLLSAEGIERVFAFLNRLRFILEKLDCILEESLNALVLGQPIWFSFYEGQRQIDHVLTQKDKRDLKEYEKDLARKYSFAREPRIRQHDYEFKGNITFVFEFGSKSPFRDSKTRTLESYLPEIAVEIIKRGYDEKLKSIQNIKTEEKHELNEKLDKLQLRRRLHEKEMTRELIIMSRSLAEAENIRKLADKMEEQGMDGALIDFAKKKADWMDPTIDYEDPILGEKNYDEEPEELLKKNDRASRYYY